MTLEVRQGEPSEKLLDLYSELSKAEYGNDAPDSDSRYLRWKVLANPQGPSYAVSVFRGESLIGRITIQRRTVWHEGESFQGGNVVDLLIAPDHRGIRSFLSLMSPLRTSPGFDFLYCTPNHRSLPLYRSLLRWPEPLQLDAFACIIDLRAVAQKRLGRIPGLVAFPLSAAWSGALELQRFTAHESSLEYDARIPSTAELKSLVSDVVPRSGTIGDRSPQFLRWRFSDAPHTRYELEFVYRAGTLAAYSVTRRMSYLGYEVLFLMDLLVAHSVDARDRLALRQRLVRRAHESEAELIVALVNASCRAETRALGLPFVKVPMSVMPREMPLSVLTLTDRLPQRLFDRQGFFMSAADFDVP